MARVDSGLATYRDVSRDEAVHLVDGVKKHAAHVMLYAKLQRKLFGRYNMKYAVLVSSCSVCLLEKAAIHGTCTYSLHYDMCLDAD